MAIAIGALLDGIPESIVIGLSLLKGAGVSLVAVIAIFLPTFPKDSPVPPVYAEQAGRRLMSLGYGARSLWP